MSEPVKIVSVDGTAMSGSDFDTYILKGQLWSVGDRQVLLSESDGDFPEYAGSTEGERRLIVQHTIKHRPGSAAWRTAKDTVKGLYGRHHDVRQVVATRHDQSVTFRAVLVSLRQLGEVTQRAVEAEWVLLDSVWLAEDPRTATVSATTSPETVNVPNAGNVPTRAVVLRLTPVTARDQADGHHKAYPITVVNRSHRQAELWPVDLADNVPGVATLFGGYDHAVDVAAGDSESTGYDLEPWQEGLGRLNRWPGPAGLGEFDDTETALWSVLTIPPGRSWKVQNNGGSVGTGVTEIPLRGDLVSSMPILPWPLTYINGTTQEVLLVTAVDSDAGTVTVTRGARGTAAQTIPDGASLWWGQLTLWLLMGWSAAPADNWVDDDYKPMVLESATTRSHNGRLHYQAFQETRAAATVIDKLPRGGSWRIADNASQNPHDREVRTGDGDRYTYWVPRTNGLAADAAVATRPAIVYRANGAFAGHPFANRWELELPVGVSKITHTYSATTLTATIPYEGRLELRGEDADGNDVLLAEYNGAAGSAVVITPDAPLYLVSAGVRPHDPKVDGGTSNIGAHQPTDADGFYLDDWIMEISDPDQIVPIWGSVQDVYQFGRPGAPVTIENFAGEVLELRGLIVPIGETVEIDVLRRTVTTDDGVMHSERGGDFLSIPTGDTDLTYTDPGIGEVSIEVEYYEGWN